MEGEKLGKQVKNVYLPHEITGSHSGFIIVPIFVAKFSEKLSRSASISWMTLVTGGLFEIFRFVGQSVSNLAPMR